MQPQDNTNIQVRPRNADRIKSQRDVTLYFVGIEWVRDVQSLVATQRQIEDEEAARETAKIGFPVKPKRKPMTEWPEVTAKSQSFKMPRLGEVITVKEAKAKDLQFQANWKGQRTLLTREEGGEAIARLIKDALASGQSLDNLDIQKVQMKKKFAQISDDEVIEMLKQRGLTVPQELAQAQAVVDEEEETADEPVEAKAQVTRKKQTAKKDES